MNADITTNNDLNSAYDEQYTDQMTGWREVGGKYKAQNIRKVSSGHVFNKVVEYGAGEGSILKYLDNDVLFPNLYALEISATGIEQIKKRKLKNLREIQRFDGYKTPYSDNEFDMAYCSHVVEHVEYPRLLLREMKRISRFQVFEIPLDYSKTVDRNIKNFLSYGHINIYTPSLFKFLLKSEGFDVLNEHFSHTDPEVIRYNWYQNRQLKRTLLREVMIRLRPAYLAAQKLLRSKAAFEEYGYNAYTCLTSNSGDLKIF